MDDEDEQEDLLQKAECPYCASTDSCPHFLLMVDVTFREASGGPLYYSFRDSWNRIVDHDDPEFEEDEQFNALLDDVANLADQELEWEFEGGPGMSSTYRLFYCETSQLVNDAVRRFQSYVEPTNDEEGDRCLHCRAFNSPAADNVCGHHVGWYWDGVYELTGAVEVLRERWETARTILDEVEAGAAYDRMVAALSGRNAEHRRLLHLATADATIQEVLEAVGVQVGKGWRTAGVHGGAGHNLYLADLRRVQAASVLFGRVAAQDQPPCS